MSPSLSRLVSGHCLDFYSHDGADCRPAFGETLFPE